MIKTGFFLITDISGYTQFLTESELVHANEILQSLFSTQLENLKSPFKVSRFQGDAIQSYALDENLIRPQMILEMVEQIYYEFKDHVRQADYNTSCDCNACSNIKNLDLKVIVHHGDFLIADMGDREELQGKEVIVAHRLEKNCIKEMLGIDAYAVFSKAAVEAAQMNEIADTMIAHTEEYEHVGEIQVFVHNLNQAWADEQKRRKTIVEKETAWVYSKVEIPIPQAIAWDRMVDRNSKQEYIGLLNISETNLLDGRVGNETKYHCSHVAGEFKYTIVDWSPFSYFTSHDKAFGLTMHKTYQLTELDKNRTLFEILVAVPDMGDSQSTMEEMQIAFQGIMDEGTKGFSKMIEEQLTTGDIVLDT